MAYTVKSPEMGRLEAEVEEAADLMRDNINEVAQRGVNLEQLETDAAALETTTETFQRVSRRIRNRFMCRYFRQMIFCVSLSLAVIIAVIILLLVLTRPWETSEDDGSGGHNKTIES